MADSGALPHQSAHERALRRVSLDWPASASVGSRFLARVVAAGFLYLGAKLDEIVQLGYRDAGLTPDESKPRGWSADG